MVRGRSVGDSGFAGHLDVVDVWRKNQIVVDGGNALVKSNFVNFGGYFDFFIELEL